MADIVVTAAQVAPCFTDPGKAEIYDFVAGATITKGDCVYIDANGDVIPSNGGAANTAQVVGIALTAGYTGAAISVLHHGCCYGFTLDEAYYALVYLADTAGLLDDDGSGTVDTIVGRVWPLSDVSAGATPVPTKVLMVDCTIQHANYA